MDEQLPIPPATEPRGPASNGQHLATVSHDGLLWDVYVEHEDDPTRTDSFAGRLCFSPAGGSSGIAPVRTAAILIEPSYEEVFYRARAFEDHHLVSLLRSLLPEDGPPVIEGKPDPTEESSDAESGGD